MRRNRDILDSAMPRYKIGNEDGTARALWKYLILHTLAEHHTWLSSIYYISRRKALRISKAFFRWVGYCNEEHPWLRHVSNRKRAGLHVGYSAYC